MIGDHIKLENCEEIYSTNDWGLYRTISGHHYVQVSMRDHTPFVSFMHRSNPKQIIAILNRYGLYDCIIEDFQDVIKVL